ncbi:replication protein [Pokkaliibacter plantistimulans]|uniref:replication protein n=1 Tax=Pokkaliibacter plantistimulans TaxID=1635171 RepID=UPI000D7475B8|nr:replication protein [Pokkaliibacter plantistimulans]
MAGWSAVPTWWVRAHGASVFAGGKQTGTSIAALKVLMAISLMANFHTRKARNSLSDLEILTGLSRPMVLAGIKDLEQKEIVLVDRNNHVSEYEMTIEEDDHNWGKLPHDLLRKHLPEITNRGAITLAALKIYFLLVAIRPNQSLSVSISHENIRFETGIQTKHVRPALDVLINHSLIRLSVSEGAEPGELKGRHNVYTLLGLRL